MLRLPTSRLLLALVVLLALWLRTEDLDVRPMHADEANQAVKAGELLESGRYAFDPHDHHGPTLYYAVLPIAWLRGEPNLAALTETTVRLVPALFGALAVLLLYLLAIEASAPFLAASAAAALFAVAPTAVYYSRDFIQESLLLTFVLATFVAALRWWRSGRMGWALLAGVAAGLAQATKASAPLFLLVGLIAGLALRPPRPVARKVTRDLGLALLGAVFAAAIFYTSFGTHPAGLRDALATYTAGAHRAFDASAHAKPWWYYLRLFGWQTEGGLTFQQLAFSALALCGGGLAFVVRHPLLRWSALYTFLIALALSLTPYKTPWHAIHLVPGLALLAGGALAEFPRRSIAGVILGVVLLSLLGQTRLTSFERPADPRNPYAYVHSAPDVRKYRPLADAALARHPGGPIRVIGAEYWPLPWYFRGLDNVGYWSTPPDDCDAALIVADADIADVVRARLHGHYRESLLGLRPGVLCVVFSRN